MAWPIRRTALSHLSLDWDLLGCFCAESGGGVGVGFHSEHMSLVMESPLCHSTGYLNDAVAEWSDQCKRRRVLRAANAAENIEDIFQEFWDWDFHGDPFANLDFTNDASNPIQGRNELFDYNNSSVSCKDSTTATATATGGTAMELQPNSSSFSSHNTSATTRLPPMATAMSTDEDVDTTQSSGDYSSPLGSSAKKRRKKVVMIVVHPFTVVKTGGINGSMTIDDINERLLRRPTRPIRHPVGEYACLPGVTAADGQGLSGKAVIGLTRIHTKGKGKITIIRTRG